MKIELKRNGGSILVVILVITGVIGVTLASYLHLVSNQNISIMRSMAWNEAVAVAEAGIEEAMAHLNRNRTNRNRDGWALDGTNVWKEKTIGSQKYKTYIEATAEFPNIISEGWVRHPQTGAMLPSPRTIRVTTTNDAIFAKGMVAKGNIDLSGRNVTVDSFDPNNAGPGGRYDITKRRDKGDVATNGSLIDSLDFQNAKIYGKASTGPDGGVELNNGMVGSLAFHAAGNPGIEDGYFTDDMNVYFPDVNPPDGLGFPTFGMPAAWNPGTWPIGSTNSYHYVVPASASAYYLKSGLTLNNRTLVITAPTTIYVENGDITISGNGGITIAEGGNLQLFMNGDTTAIAGNGILNKTGRAGNFNYWGMPGNDLVKIQGNGEFIGTVYAPQADLVLGGGGAGNQDFMGASVTKSVKMGGHFNFHYDESLGPFGQRRGYTIVTWNEVDPVAL
jgi:hypothetical protein